MSASLGTGVTALESVPTALAAFLWHRHDFTATIAAALALGGDTDTIAAMAGALSGAYLGNGSIPPQWQSTVEGSSTLVELSDALFVSSVERTRGA